MEAIASVIEQRVTLLERALRRSRLAAAAAGLALATSVGIAVVWHPAGVGDPMPDRIGLVVYPDGSAHVRTLTHDGDRRETRPMGE